MRIANTGNSDGLIQSEAYFELATSRERIPIIEYSGKATKIERRTVVEVWFRFNEYKADKIKLNNLRSRIKKRTETAGALEIRDIRTNPGAVPLGFARNLRGV